MFWSARLFFNMVFLAGVTNAVTALKSTANTQLVDALASRQWRVGFPILLVHVASEMKIRPSSIPNVVQV